MSLTRTSRARSTNAFRLALHKLGITAHKSAFDNTFDFLDADRGGSLEYHELNNHLRRRVGDPSHAAQYPGGGKLGSDTHLIASSEDPFAPRTPSSSVISPEERSYRAILAVDSLPASAAAALRRPRTSDSVSSIGRASRHGGWSEPEPLIRLPSGLCVTRQAFGDLISAAQQRYS